VTVTTLVRAHDLALGYDGVVALEDVSLEIAAGERIAVLGPNGGGKTTLFLGIAGELPPLRGTLRVEGRCGVVPQTERSRLDYPVTALDVALMGTLARLAWWRRPGRAERRAARDALDAVGLAAQAASPFGRLSGDQHARSCRTRPCCCSTSPTRASTHRAPSC